MNGKRILRQLPHNSLANMAGPKTGERAEELKRFGFSFYAGVPSAQRNYAECPREGTTGNRILGLKLSERASPVFTFRVGALFLLFGSFLLFLKRWYSSLILALRICRCPIRCTSGNRCLPLSRQLGLNRISYRTPDIGNTGLGLLRFSFPLFNRASVLSILSRDKSNPTTSLKGWIRFVAEISKMFDLRRGERFAIVAGVLDIFR